MLNGLNLQLQGKGKLMCDIYSHIKTFGVKLALLVGQVHSSPRFSQLRNQWPRSQLESQWKRWKCWRRSLTCDSVNPFAADIDEALPCYQFELAELQNCDVLKDALKPNGLIEFYAALLNETYPNIKRHAMKMSTRTNLFIHETDENSDEIQRTFASVFETGCDRSLILDISPPRSKLTVHTN